MKMALKAQASLSEIPERADIQQLLRIETAY
jgi:hypothetical protein